MSTAYIAKILALGVRLCVYGFCGVRQGLGIIVACRAGTASYDHQKASPALLFSAGVYAMRNPPTTITPWFNLRDVALLCAAP